MTLQNYLDNKKITKYQLSKLSGVPKTTISDICSGKSSIERCSARTVQQLAEALKCSMEDMMSFSQQQNEKKTNEDRSYLDCGLPSLLQDSIDQMKDAWRRLDAGEKYLHWDCDYCNLQTDINNAEVNNMISSEQAWYLREKYLRMERTKQNDVY